ncbi:hypothetical protein NEOLEDRAFT_1135634 [Neolentinus lepideus HHB14362 ss-1]|uniref:Uncharacterized protein n=1 Tax=Neolentinus lepideus HHB14362 ss-1 TaxID=1314782 RepID=A0A165RP30_9AGAM|nr:hypothetical protein NEOLEDRAFT_1135634 [Neolentinus lepideus HHB14362 ss-1]
MIRREIFHFVHMRNLPDDLRQFCSFIPGRIERIWIYCDSRVRFVPMFTHSPTSD